MSPHARALCSFDGACACVVAVALLMSVVWCTVKSERKARK